MKRHLFLLFIVPILFLSSCSSFENERPNIQEQTADTEILFQDISWGSTHQEVSEIIHTDSGETPLISEGAYLCYPESVFNLSSLVPNGGTALFDSNLKLFGYGSISTLYFLYGIENGEINYSNDAFYLSKSQILADDCELAYTCIVEELTSLYGTGLETKQNNLAVAVDLEDEKMTKSSIDIYETTWIGLNNTFVTVRFENPEDHSVSSNLLFIVYGKSDAKSSLDKIVEFM